MGTGFVACHIWPMQAATDPWLNSFVANLVWLPKPFDVFSDRAGIVRTVLQNMTYRTYRGEHTLAKETTEALWAHLPEPAALATKPAQNFFACSTSRLARRDKKIRVMTDLLTELASGISTKKRSGHSHYDAHRGGLAAKLVRPLADRLGTYLAELDNAQPASEN